MNETNSKKKWFIPAQLGLAGFMHDYAPVRLALILSVVGFVVDEFYSI